MPYDHTEAKQLLANEAEKLRPDTQGRAKAAEALVDALAKLDGTAGFTIRPVQSRQHTVEMRAVYQSVFIGTMRNGQIVLSHEGSNRPEEVQGLNFDPLTGELVGAQPDTFYGPATPGQPTRRRSALPVVVEAALKAMRE